MVERTARPDFIGKAKIAMTFVQFSDWASRNFKETELGTGLTPSLEAAKKRFTECRGSLHCTSKRSWCRRMLAQISLTSLHHRPLALLVVCDLIDLAFTLGWMASVGLLDDGARQRRFGSEFDTIVAELAQAFFLTGLCIPCLGIGIISRRAYAVSAALFDVAELGAIYLCSTVLSMKAKYLLLLMLSAGSSLLDALILRLPEVHRGFCSPYELLEDKVPSPLPVADTELAEASTSPEKATGSSASTHPAVEEPEPETWPSVDGGDWHSLALNSHGVLRAFGSNASGLRKVPQLPAGVSWRAVAAGGHHSLALTTARQLHAWGRNIDGQVSPLPQRLPPGVFWKAVAAGAHHSLALSTAGSLKAWGWNAHQQCRVPPLPEGRTWLRIAAGFLHSVAFRDDGSILSWGRADLPELHRTPKAPAGETCLGLAAGEQHSLALFSGGGILAWGSNARGQCEVPVLPPGQSWTAIAAGLSHSLGLTSTGEVHVWGKDDYKQRSDKPLLPLGERSSQGGWSGVS